jgi:hypothetical protein
MRRAHSSSSTFLTPCLTAEEINSHLAQSPDKCDSGRIKSHLALCDRRRPELAGLLRLPDEGIDERYQQSSKDAVAEIDSAVSLFQDVSRSDWHG